MSNDAAVFGSNIGEDQIPGLPPVTAEYVRTQPDQPVAEVPFAQRGYNEPRVRIVLEEQAGIPPSGQFFGLNGVGYMLKPGMPADVPVGIVDILNQAVQATPVVDDETKRVVRFRNQLRLPYRVIRHIPAHTPIPPMEKIE
jgi:hypothetical protein